MNDILWLLGGCVISIINYKELPGKKIHQFFFFFSKRISNISFFDCCMGCGGSRSLSWPIDKWFPRFVTGQCVITELTELTR